MTTATAAEVTEAQHVLQGHVVHKIGSWSEWLGRWQGSDSFEALAGLLHCGFTVPLEGRTETQAGRISFYLDVADGHSYFRLYDGPSDDATGIVHRKHQHDFHRQLSQMAFKKVVTEYFSQVEKDRDRNQPDWLRMLEQKDMLEKILWFLRPESQRTCLYNEFRGEVGVPDRYFEQLATFAFRLVELGWNYRGGLRSDPIVGEQFLAARPQFIKILVALEKLDILRKRDEYPLDGASRATLEEIALGNIGPLYNFETGEREHRHPIDIKEAFAAGSKAAAILLADQMATEAARKAAELQDAIRARAAADLQLEALRAGSAPSSES